MDSLYIVGSSGHAKVVIDAIEMQRKYIIAGLLDDYRVVGQETMGYQVLGKIDLLTGLSTHGIINVFVAVGCNYIRQQIVDSIIECCVNVNFVTVVHPNAVVSSSAKIMSGTLILAGAIVGPDSTIGEHCIINHAALVDHDCVLAAFTSLAPKATLAGNVTVATRSAVGMAACVIEKVVIGSDVVIGAGATVLISIRSNSVAVGTPARVIKERQFDDPYLS
ncbi:acetyltransferase [Shewanella morhuae]|uniref:2,3,4,5-tetrahydropyridine-2,6-dicarboxylate N-acetyltransferase n=1 Tax=Shewanella morhuae TaxID=365591 RepID=A0A380A6J5_9GAMM|nr:acetyltransferase [Shewanella morhuae]SUI75348.1 2,3,4,5-tetrahydropyridine-2,6-dicarboxylate N-acetyltransferase [Shewanella morhuae]